MSFEEINAFLDVMQEKEIENYKHEVTMQYLNAVFNNAKKPFDEYKKAININSKPQTNDDMEQMARKLNAMFGGKTIRKGGE